MAAEYLPVAALMLVGALAASVIVLLSRLLGHSRPDPVKLEPYECGVTNLDAARKPTSIRFYLVAMMFIVFDVEAAFLFPWATVMADLTPVLVGFAEVLVFLGVLLAGYVYIWKKGALEWD